MASSFARLMAGIGTVVIVLKGITSVEVLEHSRLTLTCEGDGVVWKWHQRNALPMESRVVRHIPSPNNTYVCAGSFETSNGLCRSDITIDQQYGRTIIISSIQMDDAGIYTCITNSSQNISIGMEVTVVDKIYPILNPYRRGSIILPTSGPYDVLPSEPVTFQCIAIYSGFRSPYLEMSQSTSTGSTELVLPTRISSNSYSSRQMSNISFDITPSEDENEFEVTCSVSTQPLNAYSDPGKKDSKLFQVLYGPTFLSDKRDEIQQLVAGYLLLNCEAYSYPPAVYAWFYATTDAYTGSRTKLGANSWYKADKAGNFTCEVTNDKLTRTVVKRFFVQDVAASSVPKTTSYNGFMTLVAIAAAVLAGASIFISMMVVMIKRRRAANELRQRQVIRRARAASRSTPPAVQMPSVSSTVATSVGEAPPEYSPPPMWDAPPSYDEATKTDVEMNYISGSS